MEVLSAYFKNNIIVRKESYVLSNFLALSTTGIFVEDEKLSFLELTE